MSIYNEIKDSFRFGSNLTKLIYLNLAVFLIYNLVRAFFYVGGNPIGSSYAYLLSVPANIPSLLLRPWTLLTYMFFHEEFLHILFNMLWLYWFGQLFIQFLSQRQLVGVYILGGISGALLFVLAYNSLSVFSQEASLAIALGASASVLAIVIAVSTLKPNYTIYLLFLGPVKLKYLALFSILLDIISIPVSNAGGHIAHLGGALFGFLYIKALQKNTDLTYPFSWFEKLGKVSFGKNSKLKVEHRSPNPDYDYNYRKTVKNQNLDKILDKISKSGYDSLTKEEKETLFRMKNDSIN
ncbi:MAG: rhomboid family intramembrane serine protease [Bacteroidales bacterium]